MLKKIFVALTIITLTLSLTYTACKRRDKNLGSADNPVIIGFMPSAGEAVMKHGADVIAEHLSKSTGLTIKADVAKNFVSIIDRLGSKKLDVAFINSLGYLLAKDWSGAEAVLQLKGIDGEMFYQSAMIASADSGIKNISGFNGKRFAYTDPYSMAGYLMPFYTFMEKGVTPAKTSFLENYENVGESVYSGKTDGGAIYYHKPDPYGRIRDAREKLVPKYSDMLQKVVIVGLSGNIPNTPVVFRKRFPAGIKTRLKQGLESLNRDSIALAALAKMYDATGLGPVDETGFENIRDMLKKLGKNIEEVVPGAITFYKKHVWEIAPEF